MAVILALLLMLQPPDGHGVSGGIIDWNQAIATAASIESTRRFAPVPMGSWTPAVGATRDDLGFMRAAEEFADSAPAEPYKGMIAALGHPEWRERDRATRNLESDLIANPGQARWLFRGRRHPDPEVRLRSNAILRRLNPCSTCKGAGQSKNWELYPCWDCQGTGTTWPYSMWD